MPLHVCVSPSLLPPTGLYTTFFLGGVREIVFDTWSSALLAAFALKSL